MNDFCYVILFTFLPFYLYKSEGLMPNSSLKHLVK